MSLRAARRGLFSCVNPSLFLKVRHPSCRVIADLGSDAIEEGDRCGPPGKHGELIVEPREVELSHDRVMPLLDQEAAALGGELLPDEVKFTLGEVEPLYVVGRLAAWVGEEHLCRALLDNGVSDRGGQGVTGRLCAEHHHAVLLADGFK